MAKDDGCLITPLALFLFPAFGTASYFYLRRMSLRLRAPRMRSGYGVILLSAFFKSGYEFIKEGLCYVQNR